MNKAKAMKWVKGLRSGKYKQGRNFLASVIEEEKKEEEFNFCCLGVLANIIGYKIDDMVGDECLDTTKFEECSLGDDVGTPVNGDGDKVTVEIGGKKYTDLAGANDAGVSFKKIATWIEKNYKLL